MKYNEGQYVVYKNKDYNGSMNFNTGMILTGQYSEENDGVKPLYTIFNPDTLLQYQILEKDIIGLASKTQIIEALAFCSLFPTELQGMTMYDFMDINMEEPISWEIGDYLIDLVDRDFYCILDIDYKNNVVTLFDIIAVDQKCCDIKDLQDYEIFSPKQGLDCVVDFITNNLLDGNWAFYLDRETIARNVRQSILDHINTILQNRQEQ